MEMTDLIHIKLMQMIFTQIHILKVNVYFIFKMIMYSMLNFYAKIENPVQ